MAGSSARYRASSSSRNGTPVPGSSSAGGAASGAAARRGSERLPRRRNIDKVYFGNHEIRTWYYSPYPFDEEEWASLIGNQAAAGPSTSGQSSAVESPAAASSLHDVTALQKTGGARGDVAPALQAVHAPPQHHNAAARTTSGGLSPSHAAHGHAHAKEQPPMAKALWICDGCFKYMRTYPGYRAHKKACTFTHPPGRKVYQRGAHTIWEIDGNEQKLYAQNLSLFGKLFIDHKTIYFDVEPFLFYVLTDASPQFDHVLGFFSKEKVSYDDYNLACIVTLPPAQKKGFGTLMIEFSYYLSSLSANKDSMLGTPERPLSDLGLQGYLTYWASVALRSLAILFHDQDAEVRARLLPGTYDTDVPARSRFHAQTTAATAALADERLREECLRLRRALLGLSPDTSKIPKKRSASGQLQKPAADETSSNSRIAAAAARRGMKGWAGEVPRLRPGSRQSYAPGAPQSGYEASDSPTTSTSASNGDGSHDTELQRIAASHPLLQVDESGGLTEVDAFETTLERLSNAVNLRIDDLCFALSECGLLRRKVDMDEDEAEAAAIITGESMDVDHRITSTKATPEHPNGGVDTDLRTELYTSGFPATSATAKAEQPPATPTPATDASLTLVITRQSVRDALQRMQVKRPVFDVHYARV